MKKYINKIINGDCLEVMKDFSEGSIDMILCDLPYGITKNKWDVIIPFDTLWEQYNRIIKDDGAIVLTSAQPFTSMLVMSNIKMFRYDLVWEKSTPSGFMNAKKMPLRAHDNILVFYKRLPTYNPLKIMTTTPSFKKGTQSRLSSNYGKFMPTGEFGYKDGSRFPRSIFSVKIESSFFDSSKDGKRRVHPTQKPVGLFEYLIKTYTNEGDIVLDNCIGSGTTAVAARNTKRNFIGIEILEKYWDEYGMCNSCSWHAALYEHEPEWGDWDKEKGCFFFYCKNKDYPDEAIDHRGVEVYISEKDKKIYNL